MTSPTAAYWAPRMAEWADMEAEAARQEARAYLRLYKHEAAWLAAERASFYTCVAERARSRVTLTAAELEPPAELVPFVQWLVDKLRPHLPRVPWPLWQAIGTLLHGYTRGGNG